MNQPEPQKRIVLTRYWTGDIVYHRGDGARGIVINVHLMTDRLCPRYCVCFDDRKTETCEEMELSNERVFEGTQGSAETKP